MISYKVAIEGEGETSIFDELTGKGAKSEALNIAKVARDFTGRPYNVYRVDEDGEIKKVWPKVV